MSVDKHVPKVQRALVLQGGGALGAYEAGAFNILSKNLRMEDKENGEGNRLLFDVIAGTSIGAMNGAILVSQYLETKSGNPNPISLYVEFRSSFAKILDRMGNGSREDANERIK